MLAHSFFDFFEKAWRPQLRSGHLQWGLNRLCLMESQRVRLMDTR
jgi:hypothetical protein